MITEIIQYNKVRTIARKLNSVTSNTIVTLYENAGLDSVSQIAGITPISVNGFVKNLKVYAKISSLAEATLPNFSLEDSDTDKLYKALNVEWTSPRKQLNLYISDNRLSWEPIGSISLLNPAGYPYRIYNLLDLYTDSIALEIGMNGRIGVSLQDVGYGLLTQQDSVTIFGTYLEEIVAQKIISMPLYSSAENTTSSAFSSQANIITAPLTNAAAKMLSTNSTRKGLTIFNPLDEELYIDGHDSVTTNSYMVIIAPGKYYEVPYGYTGEIWGVLAGGNGSVQIREFV